MIMQLRYTLNYLRIRFDHRRRRLTFRAGCRANLAKLPAVSTVWRLWIVASCTEDMAETLWTARQRSPGRVSSDALKAHYARTRIDDDAMSDLT